MINKEGSPHDLGLGERILLWSLAEEFFGGRS